MHYSRVPRAYWRDRLERAKALGLNAITTYVPWNFHEDVEGRFDFEDGKDVYAFADEVRKLDLLLILRVGPYMCGEWDFGGFPAWLLTKANMTLRTHNKPSSTPSTSSGIIYCRALSDGCTVMADRS